MTLQQSRKVNFPALLFKWVWAFCAAIFDCGHYSNSLSKLFFFNNFVSLQMRDYWAFLSNFGV